MYTISVHICTYLHVYITFGVTCSPVAREVAKNLALAGVGTLSLVDHTESQSPSPSSSFSSSSPSSSKCSAESQSVAADTPSAAVPDFSSYIQDLNPYVEVQYSVDTCKE
jgi:molybdopterin/thiamine biosynthesis adenylyltransferase